MITRLFWRVAIVLVPFGTLFGALNLFGQFFRNYQHVYYPANFPAPLNSGVVTDYLPFFAAVCFLTAYWVISGIQTRKERYRVVGMILLLALAGLELYFSFVSPNEPIRDQMMVCLSFMTAGGFMSGLAFLLHPLKNQAAHD